MAKLSYDGIFRGQQLKTCSTTPFTVSMSEIYSRNSSRCAPKAGVQKNSILGRYTQLRYPDSQGHDKDLWLAKLNDAVAGGQQISLPDTATDRTIKGLSKLSLSHPSTSTTPLNTRNLKMSHDDALEYPDFNHDSEIEYSDTDFSDH